MCAQSAEVECRLRSLQEDYTALQESHDRLEADSKARVAELQSQLTEMAVREKRWEERVVQERESLVEEWAGKVRLLERSLEHSKAYLQERKRSIQVMHLMLKSAAHYCTCVYHRTRKFKYLMRQSSTQHTLHGPLHSTWRTLVMEVGLQGVTTM